MKTKHTPRGFAYIDFNDSKGVKCNIQESSIATENAVWFGAENIGLRENVPGVGWVDMPEDPFRMLANNRMHLTQDQVKQLLPILKHFAKHGSLPIIE